jgi:hypothetical protein
MKEWDSGPGFLSVCLVALLLARLLTATLARDGFLDAFLFARFQVEGVPLNLLDNIFLLDLALEAPECVF